MNNQISKHQIPNTKNNTGITLVTLIITIVVLLILAVVAIGAVQDSNIIAHAQNAAGRYNTEKENEEDVLEGYECLIQNIFNPWVSRGLKVPVQYDTKYCNYISIGDSEQYLEMILYSTGGANWFGGEISNEEVNSAVEEGYLEIGDNIIEVDGMQFIFSEDGKEIILVSEGTTLGTLTTAEPENIFETDPKTRIYKYNYSEADIYLVLNPDGSGVGVRDGEITSSNGQYKINLNEKIVVETSENGPYRYVYAVKQEDGTYKNSGYITLDGTTLYLANPTYYTDGNTGTRTFTGIQWIEHNLVDVELEDIITSAE